MGTQQSHCGYVDLLVRKELEMRSAKPIIIHDNLPSVAATIQLPNKATIAVSSSHLLPSKNWAFKRKLQCEILMDYLSEADDCILLGDFNMRAAEDKIMENLCGGGWVDAWKSTGSSTKSKNSWDSFVNLYHEEGFKFRARFDRCYVRGDTLSLRQFDLIGNKPVEKKSDYLSDHFGLLVELDVASNDSH